MLCCFARNDLFVCLWFYFCIYIQFIDWFITQVIFMLYLSIWFFVANMFVAVLTRNNFSLWLLIDHFYISSSLIDYLLNLICIFFLSDLLQTVYCWLFYNKWLLCMFVTWFISYIQFIDWFFYCLYLIFFIWIIVVGMLLAL